jgi:hypothetical protein
MNTALAGSWPGALSVAPTSSESTTSVSSMTEDLLTPEQFFVPADRTGIAWTPERRLLLAVLEDAVVSFLRYRTDLTTRGKRLLRETQEWFASTDRTSVCTFESICDHLNLDADYLRLGLRRLPAPRPEAPISLSNLLRHPLSAKRHLTVVPTTDYS